MIVKPLLFFLISFFCFLNPLFSLDLIQDEELIVSNYPESIYAPGLIFDKAMKKNSVRVLYHHKNVSDLSLHVVVMVKNLSDSEQTISVFQGLGGSSKDVVYAGHTAAREFLQHLTEEPETVTLKPKSSSQIILHQIKPGQTSSGLFRIVKDAGATMSVKMLMVDLDYPQLSGFWDVSDILSQYRVAQFSQSYIKKDIIYNCKHNISSIEIGGKPFLKDNVLIMS